MSLHGRECGIIRLVAASYCTIGVEDANDSMSTTRIRLLIINVPVTIDPPDESPPVPSLSGSAPMRRPALRNFVGMVGQPQQRLE